MNSSSSPAILSSDVTRHKTSSDHDSRYYTESEADARFAPASHVGSGAAAHAAATQSQAGFIPKEIYECLTRLIYWTGRYDYGNDGSGTLPYCVVSGREGMVWKGRCDSNSNHQMLTLLRTASEPLTALFEFYHMVGTVTMITESRVRLADSGLYPPTVPGGKIYLVDLYPDTFTNVVIQVSGSGDVGFGLRIYPGDDRQISWDVDPARTGKAAVM